VRASGVALLSSVSPAIITSRLRKSSASTRIALFSAIS
jgi:hypothetical protein